MGLYTVPSFGDSTPSCFAEAQGFLSEEESAQRAAIVFAVAYLPSLLLVSKLFPFAAGKDEELKLLKNLSLTYWQPCVPAHLGLDLKP